MSEKRASVGEHFPGVPFGLGRPQPPAVVSPFDRDPCTVIRNGNISLSPVSPWVSWSSLEHSFQLSKCARSQERKKRFPSFLIYITWRGTLWDTRIWPRLSQSEKNRILPSFEEFYLVFRRNSGEWSNGCMPWMTIIRRGDTYTV